MIIEITRPETEELIKQRLQTGAFKDAEDLVFQVLQSSSAKTISAAGYGTAKDMVELFAPLRGLDIDFESDRTVDTGRDIRL